jgi:hypothetical protein
MNAGSQLVLDFNSNSGSIAKGKAPMRPPAKPRHPVRQPSRSQISTPAAFSPAIKREPSTPHLSQASPAPHTLAVRLSHLFSPGLIIMLMAIVRVNAEVQYPKEHKRGVGLRGSKSLPRPGSRSRTQFEPSTSMNGSRSRRSCPSWLTSTAFRQRKFRS